MTQRDLQSNNLRAGEFYGQVPQKRLTGFSILTEVIHRQKTSMPPHFHELAFFQFLLEGNYQETLGSKTVLSNPMTILWHPPGRIHKDEIGLNGGRFFMIELQPASACKLEELIKLPDDFSLKSNTLSWIAFRQYYEFCNWGAGSDLITEGLTLAMLGHFVKKQSITEKKAPRWLVRIVEKLNDEFVKNFTTEELAAEANVHQIRSI
jgi:hypothetical protein